MRKLKPSKRADPAFIDAFARLARNLVAGMKASAKDPVVLYVAGGAAMHFYTGARFTDGVDAAFSRRPLLPRDLAVVYVDAEGTTRSLFFDANYNETFALMHEDAHQDALRLPLKVDGVHVCVLQPVDLAVSKLSRFAEVDRQDIAQLAKDGLITAKSLRERAEASLPGYVGDLAPVRTSLELACRDIRAIGR